MSKKRGLQIPMRTTVVSAIVAMVVILTAVTLGAVLNMSEKAARTSAQQLFTKARALAKQELDQQFGNLLNLASLGTASSGAGDAISGNGLYSSWLPFMKRVLENNDTLYSVYYGFADGSFLQLVHVQRFTAVTTALKAHSDTEYAVRSIPAGKIGRRESWVFLSAQDRILGARTESAGDFDPRQRPWYQEAIQSSEATLSPPYLFNSLHEDGITAARALPNKQGVFGVDMALSHLYRFIDQQSPSVNGGIAIVQEDGKVIAASKNVLPFLSGGTLKAPANWLVDEGTWKGTGRKIRFIAAAPLEDFTGYLKELQTALQLFALVLLCITVPMGYFFASHLTKILRSLATDAERVQNLDFSGTFVKDSNIIEFSRLSEGFSSMKDTLSLRTDDLATAMEKLTMIVDLGIAMSAEQDINRLCETILQGAKNLTHADGGSLYLKSPGGQLDFQIVLNDSLGIHQGGTSDVAISLPPVNLFAPNGEANHHNVVTHAFHTGQTINIANAYAVDVFDFSGTRSFDSLNNYRSESFLTVPLRPRGGEVIGAIQLINAKRICPDGRGTEIAPFSPEAQRFVEALAAEAATALYNRELLETQKRLFDAMIQFIAGAIDAKSHYTGAHCLRVPELAMMIAEEASLTSEGPLAGFGFKSPEEWYEFKVGAWLHDCGKVTTPEFVVDKATKLETINNRIHEIRTRFEVLLRDAKIQSLEARLGGADAASAERQFAETSARLSEEFAFVASCNSGEEFMSPERIERLKQIATTSWVRNFDDRLGLSWEEQQRYEKVDRCALPCTEQLIADKAEHIFPRQEEFYQRYAGLGFTLKVPEHLYNNGELYNLSIGRGTLNAEERFKINEHIMQTIVMLERLPLPSNLSKVPQYAATHHEALSGTGYPRGLKAPQLGIPERIMAIADIFEALTAADRPYKKEKTLSESVKILYGFKKDGHIDSNIFDLFLISGVYRKYAEKNLKPSQLDEVDILPFLGPIAS